MEYLSIDLNRENVLKPLSRSRIRRLRSNVCLEFLLLKFDRCGPICRLTDINLRPSSRFCKICRRNMALEFRHKIAKDHVHGTPAEPGPGHARAIDTILLSS